jgi:hypothetical protein
MFQLNQDVANTRHADRLREAREWRRASQVRRTGKVGRVRQLFRGFVPQAQVAATPC